MITFDAPAIRADFRTGLYTKTELSRKYNCHPETITNVLNRSEDRDVYVRTTYPDNLLIMPYLDYIRGLLKKGNIQATVIYQKLIEMGAIISLSTVSRAVKRVKHELDRSAIRYETAPGQQAQADWTDFRGYTATVDGFERPLSYNDFVEIIRTHSLISGFNNAFNELKKASCLIIDNFAGKTVYDEEVLDEMAQLIKFRVDAHKESFVKHKGGSKTFPTPCCTIVTSSFEPVDWTKYMKQADEKTYNLIRFFYNSYAAHLHVDENNVPPTNAE